MTGLDIRWFLALSVALHAALLLAWSLPALQAGSPGRVLWLQLTDTSGATSAAAVPEGGKHESQPVTPVPRDTERKGNPQIASTAPVVPVERRAPAEVLQDAGPETADVTTEHMPAASTAATPEPSPEESRRHLRDSVLELVAERLTYPVIARRKGWQGVVTLELHIEADGLISGTRVNETSGYPVLDRAAVQALQLASLPHADRWLHGRSVDLVVPVEYRLLDG